MAHLVTFAALLILSFGISVRAYGEEREKIERFDEVLSLDKAIQIAVTGATTIQKDSIDVALSGAQLLQNYGQFLPNLSAAANYNQNEGRTYITSTTPFKVDSIDSGGAFQITSSINIFNGFADTSALQASTKRKSASEMTLKRAKQQIALDVSQAFIQAVFDGKLVEIAQENLKVSRARLYVWREQNRLGARRLADLLRQEAQASQDEFLMR